MMTKNNFDVKQKVSGFLALSLIMLISLTLGWYSIKTSEKLLANMPDSKVINMSKRLQQEDMQENQEIQNTLKENNISNEGSFDGEGEAQESADF